MASLRLYKKEKLCSTVAIDRLFTRRVDGCSALAYPLRAVWDINRDEAHPSACPRFVIIVPKKRIRKAVERVLMRRRIREAYRLNRDLLDSSLPVDIGFVYVAQEIKSYASVERGMRRLLAQIAASTSQLSHSEPQSDDKDA